MAQKAAFVISGLRQKRARLAGEIAQAQRALDRQRETLGTLDAVIRLFEPDSHPELIAAIRPVGTRCLLFRRGELIRACLSALREAERPVKTRWVAEYAMRAKGLENVDTRVRDKIVEKVRQTLAKLEARGVTRKIVDYPETWWELAD